MKRTGIILASGEGSRLKSISDELGLPKHLFPIGNQSILGHIAFELSKSCEQIIVITKDGLLEKFQDEASRLPFEVEIHSKNGTGFQGDFSAAFENSRNESIVMTVGDLVFPEGEIERFIEKADRVPNKLLLAFDRGQLIVPKFPTIVDFRLLMTAMPKSLLKEILDLNPESFKEVGGRFLKFLFAGKVKPTTQKTLFNINTPESYARARHYFEKNL